MNGSKLAFGVPILEELKSRTLWTGQPQKQEAIMASKWKKTNEPGIYRHEEDGRYRVRPTVVDPQSGRTYEKQETLPQGKTMEEAIKQREVVKHNLRLALSNEETAEPIITCGDYGLLWWDRRQPTLKTSTQELYYRVLKTHFLPFFGDILIVDLCRADVLGWVALADQARRIDGRKYALDTRRTWWRVIKQILLDLKAEMGLLRNPVERVKGPKVDGGDHRERKTLTRQQLAKFIGQAKKTNRFVEIVVLATTGMRPSELYGLKWKDVDYEERILHVRRSAVRGVLEPTTKTGYEREVALGGLAAEALREHRKQMMCDDHPGLSTELVFPSDNGKVRYAVTLRKAMVAISETLELEMRVSPQVLRRTVNTLCQEVDAKGITLRSNMGHSSMEMTELYSDIKPSKKQEMMQMALGPIFDGS